MRGTRGETRGSKIVWPCCASEVAYSLEYVLNSSLLSMIHIMSYDPFERAMYLILGGSVAEKEAREAIASCFYRTVKCTSYSMASLEKVRNKKNDSRNGVRIGYFGLLVIT